MVKTCSEIQNAEKFDVEKVDFMTLMDYVVIKNCTQNKQESDVVSIQYFQYFGGVDYTNNIAITISLSSYDGVVITVPWT